MAFAPYVTVEELKAWVIIDDMIDDVVITDVLESVSRWIDDHCGRHFWQDTSVSRTFTAMSCREVLTDDLVSVTSLKTDAAGDGTFEVTWATTDYQLQPVNRPTGRPFRRVEAIASLLFPVRSRQGSRSDRVEITGTWGWAAVPDTVKQACSMQASRVLKRRYSPEGVAGFSEFGAVRVARLDPDVMALLGPHRRIARLVA